MKKSLLLICFITLFFTPSTSQNLILFELQPNGKFVNAENEQTFTILRFDGLKKEELYTRLLIGVARVYISPDHVMSKVKNEMVTIHGTTQNCIVFEGPFGIVTGLSFDYVLQFEVKDERIKVRAPIITRFYTEKTPEIDLKAWLQTQRIFNKEKPNPRAQEILQDFNGSATLIVANILDALDEKASINNW